MKHEVRGKQLIVVCRQVPLIERVIGTTGKGLVVFGVHGNRSFLWMVTQGKQSFPSELLLQVYCVEGFVTGPCAARACSGVIMRPSAHAMAKACSPNWERALCT